MPHQVVYRKYRSSNFSELLGQSHIAQTISNQIKTGNIGHAYLFFGPRGTGKTSTARIFAKTVNCLSPIEKDGIIIPCEKCDSCKSFSMEDIDILELDAASNRGIDDARLLKEKVLAQPLSHKYKVIILDEAHMLTREAVNALLKIIEEPPQYILFVFCTTEFHKIPITIASRCQRFKFSFASIDDIVLKLTYILKEEGKTIENEKIKIIAKLAKGSFRDAESMLEQVIYTADGMDSLFTLYSQNSSVETLILMIIEKNYEKIWEVLVNHEQNQGDLKQLLDAVLSKANEKFLSNEINFVEYSIFIKLVGSFRGNTKEELFWKISTVLDTTGNSLNYEKITISKKESLEQPSNTQIHSIDEKKIIKKSEISVDTQKALVPDKKSIIAIFSQKPSISNVLQKSEIELKDDVLWIFVTSTLAKIFIEKNDVIKIIQKQYTGIVKDVKISNGRVTKNNATKKPDNADRMQKIFGGKFV